MTKKFDTAQVAMPKAILEFVTTVTIPAVTERMDPCECFRDRPDLYLWPTFKDYVLPVFQPIDSAPEASFTVSRLTRDANDSEIRKELQANHLAEWYHVATLIKRPEIGEHESILIEGCTKIVYMLGVNGEVFTVYVRHRTGGHVQQVGAMHIDEHDESRADRQILSQIFSRNHQIV